MSASKRASVVGALVASALSSCGAPPPGSVDHEQLAIDLGACARREPSCELHGDATPIESVVPGTESAILLRPGGSIIATLLRPSPTARLAYIAIGLRARGESSETRLLEVDVESVHSDSYVPSAGFQRTEVSELEGVPKQGAHIEVFAKAGSYEITYVVGRWNGD